MKECTITTDEYLEGKVAFTTAVKVDVRDRVQGEAAVEQCIQDVNVKGVWNTVHAIAPAIFDHGTGGAIVITSSAQDLIGRDYPIGLIPGSLSLANVMRRLMASRVWTS